jgi:hypothetical protein
MMPTEEMFSAMGAFNEELVKAGIMLQADGLKPSSAGARVRFSGKSRSVIDGPFAETKEQLGGYYLIDAMDIDDAIKIAAKIPAARTGSVEVRPIMEM